MKVGMSQRVLVLTNRLNAAVSTKCNTHQRVVAFITYTCNRILMLTHVSPLLSALQSD